MRKLLAFALLILLPGVAFADSTMSGVWNIYAMGNGEALASILGSIKLLIVPDAGNSGFSTVLLFMALLGFLVLAVKAGFNPGQNLGKMFGYIFMVWMVTLTTTHIKANVRVYDPVSNYDTVVSGVPAMVALPASIISEVGAWMTRRLESTFNVPSELTMTAGATEGLGGGFNLFGRMMADGDKFVITKPELKRSLAAYATDCVIPAIKLGKMSLKSDLLESTDMIKSLEKARNDGIITKYFVDSASSSKCSKQVETDPTLQTVSGTQMSCGQAFDCLKGDMEMNAEDMLHASSRAWETSGVMVPYETAMSSAIHLAGSSGGANAYANYSRPEGYILQKSLISSMRGGFRQAAVQTGNNEILLSASIAQAEQAQRSGWWTAAEVFKNLTGYIYTVLQAFLFGIVPIIIIALMIPGLGGKIFVNYGQLLIWLALWTPLLAIVNYLIVLFGKQDLYSVWSLSGGPTMQTEWTISEKTNNLVMAAQFLGTSVPILALGLVKGAMAFTEFVSHGIGSSFAIQAGATAASGNMSMGNISMDNVSANKYNTAMSSSVGFQDVMAFSNAGSMQQTANLGGVAGTKDGGAVGRGGGHSMGNGTSLNQGHSGDHGIRGKEGLQSGSKMSHGDAISISNSAALQDAISHSNGSEIAVRLSDGSVMAMTAGEVHQMLEATQANEASQAGMGGNVGVSAPAGKGPKGGGGGASALGAAASGIEAAGDPQMQGHAVKSGGSAKFDKTVGNSHQAVGSRLDSDGASATQNIGASIDRSSSHGTRADHGAMHGHTAQQVTSADINTFFGKDLSWEKVHGESFSAGTSQTGSDMRTTATNFQDNSNEGVAGLLDVAQGGDGVGGGLTEAERHFAGDTTPSWTPGARVGAANEKLAADIRTQITGDAERADEARDKATAAEADEKALRAQHQNEFDATNRAVAKRQEQDAPDDFTQAVAAAKAGIDDWRVNKHGDTEQGLKVMDDVRDKGVDGLFIQTVTKNPENGKWEDQTSKLAMAAEGGSLVAFAGQTLLDYTQYRAATKALQAGSGGAAVAEEAGAAARAAGAAPHLRSAGYTGGATVAEASSGAMAAGKAFLQKALAIADVGWGLYDLGQGKEQTSLEGLDWVDPMRIGMFAGHKVNEGYSFLSTSLGGSGNMIEDAIGKPGQAPAWAAPERK